jgi:hypothetical protein
MSDKDTNLAGKFPDFCQAVKHASAAFRPDSNADCNEGNPV